MEKQFYIIGCIPVHASPEPPREQQECEKWRCSKCDQAMWVSIKKRKILKNMEEGQGELMCLDCVAMIFYVNEKLGGEAIMRDILEKAH